ncbi:hypothetical protein [Actinopolymorpha pittospori]
MESFLIRLTPGLPRHPHPAPAQRRQRSSPDRRPVTINGNGATITRSTAANTPEFRIFEVLGAPAKLTIRLTTISNGISIGDQVPGGGHSGGGILVREGGALDAAVITVTGNSGFVGASTTTAPHNSLTAASPATPAPGAVASTPPVGR